MHPQSSAVEEIKTESDAVDGMEVSMPPKAVPDLGPAEQALAPQKRKAPSPPHSSNGHSPSDTSPSPTKKKKKPGLVNTNKDQDGRNDFYCWVCHREGQVLCCELCPRVYHAKCLKLAAEPEGDWFCPECEKITVAECIETQSKAMTMLNLEQLSYLLKFALQKMKQPGTEPFQKPVSLEQHPDYAEYIFHPMDLSTLEKNIKKKMYGCTEAFLADMKWILHNCIIYNGGNHKLTATAKVIIKICEHEMNEIEVCPECYLSACQKRDNWFCEPCSQPHPLVWAKLKGFPFWPAKALRDKDGQVDARFFGQHDRAWVPLNNCYLMSKEIPFSVKKTKSIFNSAMQEMEVYVENVRKKYGVFNYAPFRTPYTPNNQFQMLQDPNNPKKGTVKPEKQDKVKFSFDMTASPKMLLSKTVMSGGPGRRVSVTDMPRSPMSTNSSVHTGSDLEQDERGPRVSSSHYSGGEDSMDCTASPASVKTSNSPKPLLPTPVKQERSSGTGGILNLNLDRIKAEMDLKELSETVQQQQQQQQGTSVLLTSPKKPTRSLDKTIESCKAQLGINEISDVVCSGVEHSDSDDSDKSDSSDSEYMSEDQQKPKNTNHSNSVHRDSKKRPRPPSAQAQEQDAAPSTAGGTPGGDKKSSDPQTKEKLSGGVEKDSQEKNKPVQQPQKERTQPGQDARPAGSELEGDSDSERELVIDLGEEQGGREKKKAKRETPSAPISTTKDQTGIKTDGKSSTGLSAPSFTDNTSPSLNPGPKDAVASAIKAPATVPAASTTQATSTSAVQPLSAVPVPPNVVKKQRPLLPKENTQPAQRPATWSSAGGKCQTPSQKVQRQQQQQVETAPQSQAQPQTSANNSSTRYQTRQSIKAVQHKDTSPVNMGSATSTSCLAGDFLPPPASADVAADIAKYTTKMMDVIKGTMTEIYNDLSKSTTGNTIAEIRRLRIEIEKLQWLHQQELSEMKHNLELTMAEMRQSLEQERERLVSEVKKQMEMEKQQAVDETKKKQWCANCKKEAIFYCCWNTSYCDYPCQQAHWPEHMKSCTQSATASQQETEAEASSDAAGKPVGQSPKTQPSPTGERTSPANRGPSPSTDNTKGSSSMAVS
ncbi:MYND-type zinc finger-containing chromatin reader ZMYND8-like isoform X4 [Carassius carassius]|uniref:MYND-type zinc finger-containing chromatin reader ZMYND8-like isoform X4 n=1 Tax=Carassius carassius TaxID=217509 RepID=UPI002868FC71|nr:MYND-type zinc finger-containing chromatin reader ZMYND8-like isoform X4 [Carassius carassius]